MWAFEGFPARLRYEIQQPGDLYVYEIEVLGYVGKGLLVAFRITTTGLRLGPYPPEPVELLPVSEFEEKYKKFTLVQD